MFRNGFHSNIIPDNLGEDLFDKILRFLKLIINHDFILLQKNLKADENSTLKLMLIKC